MSSSFCFPTQLAKQPSAQNSPPYSCFLNGGQILKISGVVVPFTIVAILLTLSVGLTEPKKASGSCQ